MTSNEKLKAAFYNESRKICREVGIYMDTEFSTDSLDLISELAWKKLSLYGNDLEAFAKHAKRNTVNADDVKLLVRRNDSLKELLDAKCATMMEGKTNDQVAGAKRKRKPSSSASTSSNN